jgi:hypothetical protein
LKAAEAAKRAAEAERKAAEAAKKKEKAEATKAGFGTTTGLHKAQTALKVCALRLRCLMTVNLLFDSRVLRASIAG